MDDQYYTENTYSDPEPENLSGIYSPAQATPPWHTERPKKKKSHSTGRLIAIALCFSLLGSILGAGSVMLIGRNWANREDSTPSQEALSVMLQSQREDATLEIVKVDSGKQMTAAEVYAANVNSTVGITTSITTNFWGFQTTSAASGSGFIITNDGYILTNYHVIENSDSITVSLYDGSAYEAALTGYDEGNDIAVLKIEAENLTPVVLGDSALLNVGDPVVAIGNPLGELTFSLTSGTVSAKDRQVTLSNSVTMNLIQTDCAINSGNSGGALFNLYGEVVGITNAKYSSSSSSEASIDNIGFAIPINSVMNIVESIIEKGYISKPYMGVMVTDISEESRMYGLPQGAAIYSVVEDGPAAKAGLQSGDIVTKINGTEITGQNGLKEIVSNSRVGDALLLTVYRQGNTLEITVVIEDQVQSALANEAGQQSQSQQSSQGSFPFGSFGGRP